MEPRDWRGVLLEAGQNVAFNLSGMVAYGEIVDVRPSYRYNREGWTIHIRCLSGPNWKNNQISKVTDPHNCLVINEV